jgi:hypothetical protein
MRHSGEPDTPPDEVAPEHDAPSGDRHPAGTSPVPGGPVLRDGRADGLDGGGSSGHEAWLTAAVREAVGEVPRRLLTEVASWPAPGGAMPHDRGTARPTARPAPQSTPYTESSETES